MLGPNTGDLTSVNAPCPCPSWVTAACHTQRRPEWSQHAQQPGESVESHCQRLRVAFDFRKSVGFNAASPSTGLAFHKPPRIPSAAPKPSRTPSRGLRSQHAPDAMLRAPHASVAAPKCSSATRKSRGSLCLPVAAFRHSSAADAAVPAASKPSVRATQGRVILLLTSHAQTASGASSPWL